MQSFELTDEPVRNWHPLWMFLFTSFSNVDSHFGHHLLLCRRQTSWFLKYFWAMTEGNIISAIPVTGRSPNIGVVINSKLAWELPIRVCFQELLSVLFCIFNHSRHYDEPEGIEDSVWMKMLAVNWQRKWRSIFDDDLVCADELVCESFGERKTLVIWVQKPSVEAFSARSAVNKATATSRRAKAAQ